MDYGSSWLPQARRRSFSAEGSSCLKRYWAGAGRWGLTGTLPDLVWPPPHQTDQQNCSADRGEVRVPLGRPAQSGFELDWVALQGEADSLLMLPPCSSWCGLVVLVWRDLLWFLLLPSFSLLFCLIAQFPSELLVRETARGSFLTSGSQIFITLLCLHSNASGRSHQSQTLLPEGAESHCC